MDGVAGSGASVRLDGPTGRRRRGRSIAGVVLATVVLAGCGAGAVDRTDEVQVLVATCRAIQERTTGRPAAPVDRRALIRALDRHPGLAGDRSLVSTLRQVCMKAQAGGGAAPVPFFPPPNEP